MMSKEQFINAVIVEAVRQGYTVENSRNGLQLDFGNKKLHEGHLSKLFPAILADDANISMLIEAVAPGRPCAHRPMKQIIAKVSK